MDAGQEHYFSADPHAPSRPGQVRVAFGTRELTLGTDAGVFSRQRLDPGTAVLLREVFPPAADGPLLDLGCGYGPIAFALAETFPGRTVYAVDVNPRALELVRENAARLGVSTVYACAPDEVPAGVSFGGIYSNPPIRIGKQALHELLLRWLGRLAPQALGYLVVQRNLGSDSLADWLTAQGHPARKLASRKGYRVLEVAAGSLAPPADPSSGDPSPVDPGA